ncbi:MAG: hypothetical protein H6744_20890 [Deltaproteobacteria bacterium]|nr:hypothetical protein [Deltaproteobacteria bacterium]MCB9789140.1 hypothetical protein [Deltaproteobacteria bacterium]
MTRSTMTFALWALLGACAGGTDAPLADGSACLFDSQCASRVCLTDEAGWPGGSCSRACAASCAEGLECVVLDDGALCLPACADASGCREGWVCAASAGACLPDCREGWDCGGFACDAATGACALPTAAGAGVGEACAADRDCAAGVCVGVETGAGTCAVPCAAGECAAGQTCARLGEHLLCVPACDGASSCPGALVCNAAAEACLPDCRQGWPCGALACLPESGLCGLPGAEGAPVGAPCADGNDCASAVCAAATDDGAPTGWTGGMCVAPCIEGACPSAQSCAVLGQTPLCVPSCAGGCRPGYVCAPDRDACLPDCRQGWPCGDGFACGSDGRCELVTVDGAPLGAPCATDADCDSGVCFEAQDAEGATGWLGGTCAAPCGSVSCEGSSGCVVLDGGSWCLPSCGSAAPCRAGYVCSGDLEVCLPDCRAGWDCGGAFTCGDDGQCRIELPTLSPLGAPCASHAECGSGVCLIPPPGGGTWAQGICTEPCANGCPSGYVCTPLGPSQLCVPACASGCPTGYVCGPQAQACLPSCQSGWSCPPGATCATTGQCQGAPPPGAP